MSSYVAVVDASVLINLAAADLLPYLDQLFVQVHVPESVRRELLKWEEAERNTAQLSLQGLFESALFAPCTASDERSLDLLRAELDDGEAETIEQSQQVGANIVLIDERAGRRLAKNRGLDVRGSARILAQLHVGGFCHDHGAALGAMRKRGSAFIGDRHFRRALEMALSGQW